MGDLGGIKLIGVSELNSEIVVAGVAYWESKRIDSGLPDGSTFEPLDVPRLLPHILWKDVRSDPWDFRYRVVGTIVREHSRHDWTGRWMSEIDGQGEGSTVFRVTCWACEQRETAIYRPPYVGPHRDFKYCEAAVMPWRNQTGAIDRILVAVDFLLA